jgi:hypothetical protein
MTSFTSAGDFSQSNDCGTSLAGGGVCHLSIFFSPTTLGSRNGSVTLVNSAAGGTYNVSTTGNGVKIVSGVGSIGGTGGIKVAP